MSKVDSPPFLNLGLEPAAFARARDALGGLGREPERQVALFDGASLEDAATLFKSPAGVFVDCGCAGIDRLRIDPSLDLQLCVSTATAMSLDLADALADLFAARFSGCRGLAGDMRCALQEAIGNAVIHGNLGLDGSLRADLAGLRVFAATMAERQADPERASRPLIIRAKACPSGVEVSVEDRGDGFTPPGIQPERAPLVASGGLGLVVIHRCSKEMRFDLGGRRIHMTFAS